MQALGEVFKTLQAASRLDVSVEHEPRIDFAGAGLRRDDLLFLGPPPCNLASVSLNVTVTVVFLLIARRQRAVPKYLDVFGYSDWSC